MGHQSHGVGAMVAIDKLMMGACGLMAASLISYMAGQTVATVRADELHQAELKRIDGDNKKALADAVTKARLDEQSKATEAANIDKRLMEAKQNEIISKYRVIAGMRDGSVQLRQRFTCKSASGAVPSVAASTSSSDGTAGTGLSAEDAGFFISEASRANKVVLQLQACQALINSDRSQ